MASELSQFIESELRNKGYAYEDEEADNPHQTLIGALRVEVRPSCCSTLQKLQSIPCTASGGAIRASVTPLVLLSTPSTVVVCVCLVAEQQLAMFEL